MKLVRYDELENGQEFVYLGESLKKLTSVHATSLSTGQEFFLKSGDRVKVLTSDVANESHQISLSDPLYASIYARLIVLLSFMPLNVSTLQDAVERLMNEFKKSGKVSQYTAIVDKCSLNNHEMILITINFENSNGVMSVIRKQF